jgi:hypothetical protein
MPGRPLIRLPRPMSHNTLTPRSIAVKPPSHGSGVLELSIGPRAAGLLLHGQDFIAP